MKKVILTGIAALSMLYANNNTTQPQTQAQAIIKQLKTAYKAGIYDTLNVLNKDLNIIHTKEKQIKGYTVLINVDNMPLINIIKYEAFGIKIGLTPILTQHYLIFSVKKRKADAKVIETMIKNKSNLTPKIKYLNQKFKLQNIVENYFNKTLPTKVLLVYVKEKNINECKNNNENLHFVNRVLGSLHYKKECLNKNCKPKLNINHNETKKTKTNVINTLNKKNISLKGLNFYQLASVISKYGVITEDNKLLIGKKTFKTGDMINNNYKINLIDYNKGLIVINYRSVNLKNKKGNN